jgi:dolichol-phosphate mannosyltransferase
METPKSSTKMMTADFAIVTPLANEGADFEPFVQAVIEVLDELGSGTCYFVVDKVSKDNTLDLCHALSNRDARFITIWAPENRNVVQAYMAGFKAAVEAGHKFIIEMDAGLSHDPKAIPLFLAALESGFECAYGSRFMKGGSIADSSSRRSMLSRTGTVLSRVLLGLKLHDATSGFQGFERSIVQKFLQYQLLSEAHFFHPELRYLMREKKFVEIPIHYRAPSPRVSYKVVSNSVDVLLHYFKLRILGKAPKIV